MKGTPFRSLAAALLLAVILILSTGAGKPSRTSKNSPEDFLATVTGVIDGDTLSVKYRARNEHLRLIGIDAPESRDNKRAGIQSERNQTDLKTILKMGSQSALFTKRLVHPGDVVRLEFDSDRRDKYRRLLAYVYLKDGRMLNEVLVREGYAYAYSVPGNVRYKDKFLNAAREARTQRRGLWH